MLGLVGIFAWRAAADKPLSFGDPFPDLTTDQLIQFSDGAKEPVLPFESDRSVLHGSCFAGWRSAGKLTGSLRRALNVLIEPALVLTRRGLG